MDGADVLSERLASFGGRDLRKRPPLKAVYIGGPSAVGKSTTMKRIKASFPWARVANVNFRDLYALYGGDAAEAAHHLVSRRNAPMIYEHTNECTTLYRIVHEYMRRAKDSFKEDVHSCYRECADALNKPSADTMIVMLDTTKSFVQRYERRLATDYNGIDYRDPRYLYFQVAAYLAFLAKRHLYPFMIVSIAAETGSPSLFGEPDDCGLIPLLHGLVDRKRDIVADELDFDAVSRIAADCHISRVDESSELS